MRPCRVESNILVFIHVEVEQIFFLFQQHRAVILNGYESFLQLLHNRQFLYRTFFKTPQLILEANNTVHKTSCSVHSCCLIWLLFRW